MNSPRPGIAYLFERFPSFTQTFCFREVLELRNRGLVVPTFSIRRASDEPDQDYPDGLVDQTIVLPADFSDSLAVGAFRKRSRAALKSMRSLWGDDSEKRRIYEALWLLPKLNALGVNHVHVHFAGIAARTAFWLRRLGGVTYSFTAHANDIFCDEPHDRLGMLIHEAKFVVTVSDFSRRFLVENFPQAEAKLHRVYNGIHLDRFQLSSPESDTPLILSVGRYIEKKGFADLIDALASVKDLPFQCKIIGQGPLEESLKQQVSAHNLSERIEITGPRTEGEVAAMLAKSSLFVLPCVNASDGGKDNLPTVIMEAMAAGVPVISTRVAGVPEMIDHGVTGVLVPERQVSELAAAIRDILQDPAKAEEMGRAGRHLCESRFATGVTTGQLFDLFQAYDVASPRKLSFGRWISRLISRD